MFTGIVQALCRVVAVDEHDGVRRLTVDLGRLADGLHTGASVATNGVCLTATGIEGTLVTFDAIAETLATTTIEQLTPGRLVNVERSLRFGDELGGHLVSGHVSGTASVHAVEADGANRTMWFDVDAALLPYLLWKGWVAVDGASLTISRVDRPAGRIAVSLIPETLARTTLGQIDIGGMVNVEIDAQTQAIVETVRSVLADPDMRRQLSS